MLFYGKISANRAKSQIYLCFSEVPPNFEGFLALNIVQTERKAKFICKIKCKFCAALCYLYGMLQGALSLLQRSTAVTAHVPRPLG